MNTPEVSVVIPVLDGERVLGECLDAIAAQQGAPQVEILVVDNGSRDGTAELVRRHPAGAQLLREETRGPYAARNTGIAAARGRIVAFTDADCLPDPGWLAGGAAEIDAGAGLVGGAIVQRVSAHPTIWERYDCAVYLKQEDYVTRQGFAATANLFVLAEVFGRVGPFRPELVASGDWELGQRATKAGYRLAYAAAARVMHRPRTTFRDTWELHRKLGSGFAELARAGLRGKAWQDPALRLSLAWIASETGAQGPPLRRRQLLVPHAVAMAGRWVGRLTGRG